jgi:DNA (cytosine-5)-methyltransferase 1
LPTQLVIEQPELRSPEEFERVEAEQAQQTIDDREYLRSTRPPAPVADSDPLTIVDLFSGCGGMTFGAIEGARRAGRGATAGLAVDLDDRPLDVLRASLGLGETAVKREDLGLALRPLDERVTAAERRLFENVSGDSILVAGPPCQGHSTLNNHTRHDDPRNDLYLAVARAAKVLRPKLVIIENVRGVGIDRRGAMGRCVAHLEKLRYKVVAKRVDLDRIGVPQKRVRHVIVAARSGEFQWALRETPQRTVAWAIEDLLDIPQDAGVDRPSAATIVNQKRMDWLFANDAHDLPNHLRPSCHHTKHSYVSMYGRLRWDRPAQTITSGFGSMGQGRYVHPLRSRTLTPHEAARLQFLPDFVRLDQVAQRTALAEMIGNVAPPALTISLVQSAVMQGLV